MRKIKFEVSVAKYLNVGDFEIFDATMFDPKKVIGKLVIDKRVTPWKSIGTITDVKALKDRTEFTTIEFTAEVDDDWDAPNGNHIRQGRIQRRDD